jgi:hypothetical protein
MFCGFLPISLLFRVARDGLVGGRLDKVEIMLNIARLLIHFTSPPPKRRNERQKTENFPKFKNV